MKMIEKWFETAAEVIEIVLVGVPQAQAESMARISPLEMIIVFIAAVVMTRRRPGLGNSALSNQA